MLEAAVSEELPVSQARAGAPEAWDRLFRRYQLPLFAFVFEWVRDEQLALDLVQETFIRAVRHLSQLRDDDRFGSWLFGIAHQQCAANWRRSRRFPRTTPINEGLAVEQAPAELEPDARLIRREDEERLAEALATLPEEQRTALVLHWLEEFSLGEIAAITGAAPGTIKSRIHYAKRALRQHLENDP